ncbi:MAG TPA: dihydrodipicolinate synthase family protein [Thermomicrobiales bacterium]|nr:dihydrodipicolinate synthase family protein [Thermomicrobiales bacterium]
MRPLAGVYTILTTPFLNDGSLDEISLARLIEVSIGAGADGLTALGVAGEAHKLTDSERRRVVELVVETAAGRVPVVVGASRESTEATIEACREAERAGVAGVMIAPPTFVQPGPALARHFARVSAATTLPITLQDYPPVNGVTMSPADMATLVDAAPSIVTVKLEDPPTPQRIAQLVDLLGDRGTTVVGGSGGLYLLDELRRGAAGTMTGFAYPEVLVRIWRAWRDGDRVAAAQAYYRYLPLLVFEGQPKLGVAIRKEILRHRGLIDTALVRQPGPQLAPGIADDLAATLAWLRMDDEFPPSANEGDDR